MTFKQLLLKLINLYFDVIINFHKSQNYKHKLENNNVAFKTIYKSRHKASLAFKIGGYLCEV